MWRTAKHNKEDLETDVQNSVTMFKTVHILLPVIVERRYEY